MKSRRRPATKDARGLPKAHTRQSENFSLRFSRTSTANSVASWVVHWISGTCSRKRSIHFLSVRRPVVDPRAGSTSPASAMGAHSCCFVPDGHASFRACNIGQSIGAGRGASRRKHSPLVRTSLARQRDSSPIQLLFDCLGLCLPLCRNTGIQG